MPNSSISSPFEPIAGTKSLCVFKLRAMVFVPRYVFRFFMAEYRSGESSWKTYTIPSPVELNESGRGIKCRSINAIANRKRGDYFAAVDTFTTAIT